MHHHTNDIHLLILALELELDYYCHSNCTYADEHGARLVARAQLRVLLVGRRGGRRRHSEHATDLVLLALHASLKARLELLELQLHRLRHRASAKAVQLALALT